MKVRQYRCYQADQRLSMDIYAQSLEDSLRKSRFSVQAFTPSSSLEKFSKTRSVMRFLRYISYPNEVKVQAADIHHVIDHGYAHLLPRFRGGKKCVTVHDLIPVLNWKGELGEDKEQRLSVKKPWLNLFSLSYLSKYDRVISISESTAQDLVRVLEVDPQKIDIIPPAIANSFRHRTSEEIEEFSRKYDLDRHVKWVMVSGSEFYKNHKTCLEVLKRLNRSSETKVNLIKTGLPSIEFEAMVSKMGLSNMVTNLFFDDVSEIPLVYSFADCLLFPSLYEGFGMPVAEALACGTPVVSSDRGSLPEVGGDLSLQTAPYDIDGICSAVSTALFDRELQAKVRNEGDEWVSQFRSNIVAQKLEESYERMLIQ